MILDYLISRYGFINVKKKYFDPRNTLKFPSYTP